MVRAGKFRADGKPGSYTAGELSKYSSPVRTKPPVSKPILTLKHAGYVITKAQEAMAARDKFLFGEDDMADGSFQTQTLVVAEHLKDADDATPIPVLQITREGGKWGLWSLLYLPE